MLSEMTDDHMFAAAVKPSIATCGVPGSGIKLNARFARALEAHTKEVSEMIAQKREFIVCLLRPAAIVTVQIPREGGGFKSAGGC